MRAFRPWLASLFLFLTAFPPAGGADAPRTVQLRFYAHGEGGFEGLRLADSPSASRLLSLYPGCLSASLSYAGPDRLELVREHRENGVPRRVPAASAAIPPSLTDILVLVVAVPDGAGGKPGLRLFLLNDAPSALPPDHFAIYNATGVPLEGRVGSTVLPLAPGQSPARSTASLAGRGAVPVVVIVAAGGTQRIVFEQRLRFHPGRRTLIVLLPPRRTGRFELVGFRLEERGTRNRDGLE